MGAEAPVVVLVLAEVWDESGVLRCAILSSCRFCIACRDANSSACSSGVEVGVGWLRLYCFQ